MKIKNHFYMLNTTKLRTAIGVVILLTAMAGCLTMTAETTVTADGEIESYVVSIEMDEFVYNAYEQEARDDGYDDVEAYLTDGGELVENASAWESIEYSEEEKDDGDVNIEIVAQGGNPDQLPDVNTNVTDDTVTYETTNTFEATEEGEFDEDVESQISIEYVVHMPGEVSETNGEIREDNESVRWDYQDHAGVDRYYVTSERPANDSIPGFGFLAAVLAILSITAAIVARDRFR